MPNKLTERLRGSLSTLLYFFNTLFWFVPIFSLGLLKLLLPLKGWRTLCNWLLDGCASCWIGFNNLIQKTIIKTPFEVVGIWSLPTINPGSTYWYCSGFLTKKSPS